MRRLRSRAGYTLLELMVSLAISAIVLLGLFAIMTSMINMEVEGLKKGTVNSWSLASLIAMNREIEDASIIFYPGNGGSEDRLGGCENYSYISGAALSADDPVTTFYYCYDSANHVMRRLIQNGCAAKTTTPPACTAANYGTAGGNGVIATEVYYANYPTTNTPPVFTRDSNARGGVLRLRYVVGDPVSTPPGSGKPVLAKAQSMAFDTTLSMNKQFANTSD
jgi:prepilin-type N-terminal cleavage/methylation domain-containing protein